MSFSAFIFPSTPGKSTDSSSVCFVHTETKRERRRKRRTLLTKKRWWSGITIISSNPITTTPQISRGSTLVAAAPAQEECTWRWWPTSSSRLWGNRLLSTPLYVSVSLRCTKPSLLNKILQVSSLFLSSVHIELKKVSFFFLLLFYFIFQNFGLVWLILLFGEMGTCKFSTFITLSSSNLMLVPKMNKVSVFI